MSIYRLTPEQAIRNALASNRLVAWKPTRKGFGSIRILALEPKVHAEISKPWGDDDSGEERRRQKVITSFDNFVGDRLALSLLFKQISKAFGIAAMRILSPKPGVRVMGGFVSETVFIGTSFWNRNELPSAARPTQVALLSHKELTQITRDDLKRILGDVPLYCPPSLRR